VPLESSSNDPLVDSNPEWARHERTRSSERHRRRRRSRKGKSRIRAQIRVRIWIACTSVLLLMCAFLYYVLGRDRGPESGHRLDARPVVVAIA
jgi:hypothetical protein